MTTPSSLAATERSEGAVGWSELLGRLMCEQDQRFADCSMVVLQRNGYIDLQLPKGDPVEVADAVATLEDQHHVVDAGHVRVVQGDGGALGGVAAPAAGACDSERAYKWAVGRIEANLDLLAGELVGHGDAGREAAYPGGAEVHALVAQAVALVEPAQAAAEVVHTARADIEALGLDTCEPVAHRLRAEAEPVKIARSAAADRLQHHVVDAGHVLDCGSLDHVAVEVVLDSARGERHQCADQPTAGIVEPDLDLAATAAGTHRDQRLEACRTPCAEVHTVELHVVAAVEAPDHRTEVVHANCGVIALSLEDLSRQASHRRRRVIGEAYPVHGGDVCAPAEHEHYIVHTARCAAQSNALQREAVVGRLEREGGQQRSIGGVKSGLDAADARYLGEGLEAADDAVELHVGEAQPLAIVEAAHAQAGALDCPARLVVGFGLDTGCSRAGERGRRRVSAKGEGGEVAGAVAAAEY